jgi:glycosyltransferase involved in cell wall biosynthesis
MKVIACTPTKNRRWSYAFSKACMETQLLKPDVWVVLDNSETPDQDWSPAKENPLVYYEEVKETKPIGWLRNRCLELALERGADFIVFWDDDDYYPPTRISSGVEALVQNPTGEIAGSSQMYLLLTKENVLMTTGPFHDHHATAATWTIRKKYAETHRFDPEKRRGEELTFTNEWKAIMIQVPAEKVIVVMGHTQNTVDKSDLYVHPHLYNAAILNDANGRMVFRLRWPVQWDLFRSTFSV